MQDRTILFSPLERHPKAPFAACLDDVKPGAELLCVGFAKGAHAQVVEVTREPFFEDEHDDSLCLFPYRARKDRCYLYGLGIVPESYDFSRWNEGRLSIVNTREARIELVDWLLKRRNPAADKSAKMVVRMYPADFIVAKVEVNIIGDQVLVIERHPLLADITTCDLR